MSKSQISILSLTLMIFLFLSFTRTLASPKIKSLEPSFILTPKKEVVLNERARQFLKDKNNERVKVWMFFTDKGIFNQSDFNAKASQIELSEKLLKRRAKVNKTEVVFADLPLEEKYIRQLEKMGAVHKRSSKWLNAASFEIPLNRIDEYTTLPFISEIKPVARYKNNSFSDNVREETALSGPGDPVYLDYGPSLGQLQQIHVISLHEQGYSGSGVILAIMDTGYRKSHDAFAQHYIDGRVLAEYDFINNDNNTANEAGDVSTQWNHGTLIWSTSAGYANGAVIGPAYGASFLLAKTEDVAGEYPGEEDNWIAALEWADSHGADVITTSLGYSDWYSQADYDGNTAPITLAANTASSLGIVMCNSAGNSGPGATTISPPADAFDILTVGAVDQSGSIAGFSSRGPTADGRIKPEVCALGVSTRAATAGGDSNYGYSNGTSLSTPLVAGAVCLMIEAHPNYPPELIRTALMETADNADNPNNAYGWGIINAEAALGWGVEFSADNTVGEAPLTVQFTGNNSPQINVLSHKWYFGDGDSSDIASPQHIYTQPGNYDVNYSATTDFGLITNIKSSYISVLGDTLVFVSDTGYAGQDIIISVNLINSQPLENIVIPFTFSDYPKIRFKSASLGQRTQYFERFQPVLWDSWNKKYAYELRADMGGGSPPLEQGSGEIMKITFTIDINETGGNQYLIDTLSTPLLVLSSTQLNYTPVIYTGAIFTETGFITGDLDGVTGIDIGDLVYLVDYQFNDGPAPVPMEASDVNGDEFYDIGDIVYLVDYMFNDGPPPI